MSTGVTARQGSTGTSVNTSRAHRLHANTAAHAQSAGKDTRVTASTVPVGHNARSTPMSVRAHPVTMVEPVLMV